MQNKPFLAIRQELFKNFAEIDPSTWKLFTYLLHECFYIDNVYKPMKLKYKVAIQDTGLSKQTIWRGLKKLEEFGYINRDGEDISFKLEPVPNRNETVPNWNQQESKLEPKSIKLEPSSSKMEPVTPLKPSPIKAKSVPVIPLNSINNKTNIIEGRNVCLDRIINWEKDPEFLKIRSKSEHKAMPKFEMNPESRKLLEWLAKETEGDTASTRFLEKYQLDLFKYALIIAKSPIAYWIKKMTDFMQNASIVTIPDDYVKASPEELQENWIERQKRTAEITKRNTEKYTKQKEESDKYYNDMDRAVDDLEKNDPGQFEILREEAFLNTKSKMPYVHEPSTHSMFNRSVRSLIFNQINGAK